MKRLLCILAALAVTATHAAPRHIKKNGTTLATVDADAWTFTVDLAQPPTAEGCDLDLLKAALMLSAKERPQGRVVPPGQNPQTLPAETRPEAMRRLAGEIEQREADGAAVEWVLNCCRIAAGKPTVRGARR